MWMHLALRINATSLQGVKQMVATVGQAGRRLRDDTAGA